MLQSHQPPGIGEFTSKAKRLQAPCRESGKRRERGQPSGIGFPPSAFRSGGPAAIISEGISAEPKAKKRNVHQCCTWRLSALATRIAGSSDPGGRRHRRQRRVAIAAALGGLVSAAVTPTAARTRQTGLRHRRRRRGSKHAGERPRRLSPGVGRPPRAFGRAAPRSVLGVVFAA